MAKKKTDFDVMLGVLNRQKKTAKNIRDWDKIDPRIDFDKNPFRKNICLDKQHVGFAFNSRGTFLGLFNWKD